MIPSNVRSATALGLFVALAASAAGCSDPLKKVQLIERPRVLGARVEVESEPGRAAPRPGENASVRFLVAAPELEPALAWSFVGCVASPNNLGVPSCDGAPFSASESPEPAPGEPLLALGVPLELDPEATPRLAVLGVVCPDAPLDGSGEAATCSADGGTHVSLELELARDGDVNLNPSFGAVPLRLDGAEWPAGSAAGACAGAGLVEVAAGSGDHRIELEVADDARDPLPVEQDFDPEREELQLSHFASDGGLDRPFSSLAAAASETRVDVAWRAPAAAPAQGELVRFWFVVRDLRGGSDFTERSLCVVP